MATDAAAQAPYDGDGAKRVILVTRTEFPLLFFGAAGPDEERLVVTDDSALARGAGRRGLQAVVGSLESPDLFRRLGASPGDRFLLHLETERLDACLAALLEAQGAAVVAVLGDARPDQVARWGGAVLFLPAGRLGSVCLGAELERAAALARLARIRDLFHDARRVLLLVQDDPDPDGLASALALRTLLGRNGQSAVIGSFGPVSRPENLAMLALLEIRLELLRPEELAGFDAVALLDVQPFHSPQIPTRVDLVIDHHPLRTGYEARLTDVRPHYGATASILTEYLLASDTRISQRLATALLYGIKTDTQLLGRDSSPRDVAAFCALYPLANHPLLRRMDRPQLPRRDLDALGRALGEARFEGDVLFAHLGELSREDVVPQIADFCLGVEGVEWAVVSGIYERRLVLSARAYGERSDAGAVVKAAFESYGSAGGHRSSAKAVVALPVLPAEGTGEAAWVRDRFLGALGRKAAAG
jgi:nanoRNase/pAp phosphatase (c-di-AMP/oligoRNAs hydrolase)